MILACTGTCYDSAFPTLRAKSLMASTVDLCLSQDYLIKKGIARARMRERDIYCYSHPSSKSYSLEYSGCRSTPFGSTSFLHSPCLFLCIWFRNTDFFNPDSRLALKCPHDIYHSFSWGLIVFFKHSGHGWRSCGKWIYFLMLNTTVMWTLLPFLQIWIFFYCWDLAICLHVLEHILFVIYTEIIFCWQI